MSELTREDEFNVDDIKIHSAEVVDKPIHASPYAKPVEIIVEATAWGDMNRHACEDLRYESGGIMLGGIYEHDGALTVRITTAVAARDAVNSVASIQFTYDTWNQMEKEHRANAPDEKLLGWYHTHPGFSAFFSETDRFMHEHFFTQPWHVALVIDPVRGEHRFYRWDGGHVREVKEFLLKIDDWPGPQLSLGAVLPKALRKAARQAEAGDATSAVALGPAIEKLASNVRRVSSEQPLRDLLSLIVACAELPQEAVAEARRRVAVERNADSPIRYADLEICSHNVDPQQAISIAQRWLVQQTDHQRLHVHSLDPRQPFRIELTVPLPVLDLAVNDNSSVFILTRNQQAIYRLDPSLVRLRMARRAAARVGTMAVTAVDIDWRDHPRQGTIGQILAARNDLYLLTKNELWILAGTTSSETMRYHFAGVHRAFDCGWDSFADVGDWTSDPGGNLYLLKGKEVQRFERATGSWKQFVLDETLSEPRSLAAGMSALSIYDSGASPAVVEYSLADGHLLGRRRFDAEVQRLRIWHLFSDGDERLYLVTDGHVFQIQ